MQGSKNPSRVPGPHLLDFSCFEKATVFGEVVYDVAGALYRLEEGGDPINGDTEYDEVIARAAEILAGAAEMKRREANGHGFLPTSTRLYDQADRNLESGWPYS